MKVELNLNTSNVILQYKKNKNKKIKMEYLNTSNVILQSFMSFSVFDPKQI